MSTISIRQQRIESSPICGQYARYYYHDNPLMMSFNPIITDSILDRFRLTSPEGEVVIVR